jgi:hypothetical protein
MTKPETGTVDVDKSLSHEQTTTNDGGVEQPLAVSYDA